MSTRAPLPCGAWPSPLTPELTATGTLSLSYAAAHQGRLYWIEGRATERGRSVLVARQPSGEIVDVLDAETDVRSRVHEYGGTPWVAVGGSLAYAQFNDQQWRVRHAAGEVSVLTPAGCRYADPCAMPDGRGLVCVREDHRGAGEAVNSVVALDLQQPGEAGRVLFSGSDFVAWPRISADGKRLALIAWDHPSMPWDDTRLVVGEMTDAGLQSTTVVAGGAGESVLEPQWDTDASLYFLSDRSGWWNLYRWHDGLTTQVLSVDAELGGALWNPGLSTYALTGDGRAVLRLSRNTVDQLAVLDLHSGSLQVLDLPFVAFASIGLLDAHTAFALVGSADDVPALVTVDLRSGTHQVVRRAGAAPVGPSHISSPQAIEFMTQPGADGQARTAHAWFYAPHSPGHQPLPGERPPLMVVLHGGPTSHSGRALKISIQFWTSRGFAVVDVNYGGSTGYGRAYRERLRGEWGVVDLQDAVAAVDHLVGQGLVDGARVVIRGGSAGGFTVLSALAFTDRFAAGINYYGVADLESLASDTHKFESRYLDSLVAPLPAGRQIYLDRSPTHHMARCKAALITFQGSDDRAVPPQQSRAIVAAARAAGCPVAYLEFEGEGHGFRQAPNIVRALQHELVFLGRVFGYTPAEDLPPVHIDNESALRQRG